MIESVSMGILGLYDEIGVVPREKRKRSQRNFPLGTGVHCGSDAAREWTLQIQLVVSR